MMEDSIMIVPDRECNRCGHRWIKRVKDDPKRCPSCKSQYWNVERTRNVKKKEDK